MNPFEVPQKSVEIKIKVIFFLSSSGIWTGRVNNNQLKIPSYMIISIFFYGNDFLGTNLPNWYLLVHS